ncbi:ETF-ubiquinone oxidoreductase [Spathaspora passalidarum NRRL Y-27907]|uniref:Electron transfer flavoprotein-ubiquinone oxidoreductase n=1 Tax=Spathaspora passalidarum (strain NRRL Y-27907 / 11-Y1) TaxID=619300 RepID=G3ANH8_SPAPN|nr:ETF-ubiquinone oxidoreductase [Spathaspora passalidarum NRRL Y-27907]EGW31967.1 ETF-ubiquinone oxidoreductase [Spathaspora passalidarum NRRL Y-27907]
MASRAILIRSTRLLGRSSYSALRTPWRFPTRSFTTEQLEILNQERPSDHVDVCIVGGGPAGLATAIKLKQLDNEKGSGELRVVVLEKAGDFGGHTVSGAILEPGAFLELFPDAQDLVEESGGIPLPKDIVTKVTKDGMKYLTEKHTFPLPEVPALANHGKNFVVSLNNVVKYLSEQAEELGVELYPGISVSELIYNESGDAIKGVATQDMGIAKDGTPKDSFERGMEFLARVTVLAEGCHGSLTKKAISKFDLRKDCLPQTYGLGIKEVWEVKPENFKPGFVAHTMGYPLSFQEYGGGFQYHFGDGLVAVGLVIGLDYANPYVSPYQEFQKLKLHPYYSKVLEGGKCISYAARALNEGGYQSIPQLHFPGGLLVGCSAGFVNVPKIKGTHTAVKSGIVAAEEIFKIYQEQEFEPVDEDTFDDEYKALDLSSYEESFKQSWAYKELYAVRNVRPSFNTPLRILGGLTHSGLTTLITKGYEPWTLKHKHTDSSMTQDASKFKPIDYPKPDGVLTFDILTSVSRTGTSHDEDEPCHLKIPNQDERKHAEISWPKYKGVEQRFCPAGVYEYIEDANEPLGVKFQINSQNCIHCKTCDIKVPTQDIDWEVPEGGDGPKYYMS